LAITQFYGVNEGTEPVFFGDKEAAKFGTFFVKDGKVVGAFLESGSNDENAAIKKIAATQPDAPADLANLGLEFAAKL
jgi:monodehydroascorbate reductase (NADH)